MIYAILNCGAAFLAAVVIAQLIAVAFHWND